MISSIIHSHLRETIHALSQLVNQTNPVEQAAAQICHALQAGKKLVIFGNGGSAADAQHFAAELVGRFEKERPGLPAIALTTDTSILTAVGNDFSYDQVFSRQVQALVQPEDIVIGISTSGNSKSVLAGIEEAKRKRAWTVGLTGGTGGKLKALVDCCICVPAQRTAHIQECHIALIHAMCVCVDEAFVATPA